MDIQKGVPHNFSKIVFLAKQILEVNANTIAQTIFFSNQKYFYFRFGNQKSVSRGVEMGTFLCRRVKFQKCGLRPFECPLFIYLCLGKMFFSQAIRKCVFGKNFKLLRENYGNIFR